ncbi:MAG: hypothetical protein IJ519_05790 [Clostridia bacterium]|nr:hypothetical protein [Clostridia bacterium]
MPYGFDSAQDDRSALTACHITEIPRERNIREADISHLPKANISHTVGIYNIATRRISLCRGHLGCLPLAFSSGEGGCDEGADG